MLRLRVKQAPIDGLISVQCRRLLGNMSHMFERAQKRGAWALWLAMVEEARDRQARAHYRRVLQHKVRRRDQAPDALSDPDVIGTAYAFS